MLWDYSVTNPIYSLLISSNSVPARKALSNSISFWTSRKLLCLLSWHISIQVIGLMPLQTTTGAPRIFFIADIQGGLSLPSFQPSVNSRPESWSLNHCTLSIQALILLHSKMVNRLFRWLCVMTEVSMLHYIVLRDKFVCQLFAFDCADKFFNSYLLSTHPLNPGARLCQIDLNRCRLGFWTLTVPHTMQKTIRQSFQIALSLKYFKNSQSSIISHCFFYII